MQILDMRNKACPIPVVECKSALVTMQAGEQIQILVDNEVAKQNLWRLAQKQGCSYQCEEQENHCFLITLQVQNLPKTEKNDQEGAVVAIGTACMGRGDDTLGRMLMKSFLYSLTELEVAPSFILLFNEGVQLAVHDSASLEDLRTLEKKGTQIAVCGACLDFYKLKEALAIGYISNMYAIAGTMATAKTLVNL